MMAATGIPIALTPKAYDLLVTLVQHHNRALSKEEILTLVWSGAFVEEGNLAQQVLLLRRALVDASDCVATMPRHGYRFVAPVIEPHENHSPWVATSPHCLVWDERQFPLREGFTVIGRAEDADLEILLPSISRHHARVVVRGLAATIEDPWKPPRHLAWVDKRRRPRAARGRRRDQARNGPARLPSGDARRHDASVIRS